MKSWLLTLPLLLLLTATALAGPTAVTDPLIGRWLWHNGTTAIFEADGTASVPPGFKGTWTFTNNSEVQRKYRLVWNDGQITDKAILSEDKQTIQIQNSAGEKFTARRAPPEPTAGGSPPHYFGVH